VNNDVGSYSIIELQGESVENYPYITGHLDGKDWETKNRKQKI